MLPADRGQKPSERAISATSAARRSPAAATSPGVRRSQVRRNPGEQHRGEQRHDGLGQVQATQASDQFGTCALAGRVAPSTAHHGSRKAPTASATSRPRRWCAVQVDLDAFFDEYSELLAKYGHGRQDAPPGARLMQLRMFYIPDEPAEPEP